MSLITIILRGEVTMSITAMYGFGYYRTLVGSNTNKLIGYGKLPFVNNEVYNGESRFTFEKKGDRTWLTSYPTTGSRHTSQRYDNTCIRRNRPPYYNCLEYRGWVTDWTATNARRRVDSSRRTPSINFSASDIWHEKVHAPYRFYTMGLRFFIPRVENRPPHPIYLANVGGDTLNRSLELLRETELPVEDNSEFYFEFTLDRETGVVRRWINDVELSRLVMVSSLISDLASIYVHIGGKSNSTAASAPPNSDYSINDIYGMVETSEEGEMVGRLGAVEIDHLPVENFLLNRFWSPPAEAPVVTVNRIKTNDSTSGHVVEGDTHADPATVVFNNGVMELDSEDLYLEVHAFGHCLSSAPVTLEAEATNDDGVIGRGNVELPTDGLSNDLAHSRILSLEAKLGAPKLRHILTNDFQLKLSFSEVST